MDLFSTGEIINLLPRDGMVNYYGKIMPASEADFYFNRLLDTIQWKNDEALIGGRHIVTARKVALYADGKFSYTYSGSSKTALPWTKELLELKKVVENTSGDLFNSCLLNLYHHGNEGMAWHSDNESSLRQDAAIGSFSLGAERKFSFKHKTTGEKISLVLEHGSLLVMKGRTQNHWLHRLPPTVKVRQPRINLTFRTILP